MRILLVLTLLLGSIAAGCQNSDVNQTSQTGDASPTQNATAASTPAATSTPATPKTPQSSSKSESKPSTKASKQVATTPSSPASNQQTCQISAYLIDKDPKGVNVYSGAGDTYKIVGNIPTNTLAVIVKISASQGDWVQVTKADSPEKTQFQGTGWVSSQLLGTSTRGYATKSVSVYSSANPQSSIVGSIPSQRGAKLLGCDRSWALVQYEGIKGWLAPDAQCANPLTTCP
jgi:uncharacterized protein YraI